MRIELVGGPGCGTVRDVRYLNRELTLDGVTYLRRDREWSLSSVHGACYGQAGHRFYDAAKGGRNGERG